MEDDKARQQRVGQIKNTKGENMDNVLTIENILDENTKIEKITDKETLKNVIGKIISITSYPKVGRTDIMWAIEEVYREFNIK